MIKNLYLENSLAYNPELCTGCKMCSIVCPHAVWEMHEKRAVLKNSTACMECGACQLNCSSRAIKVDSGVGCAMAMFKAALKGKELTDCSCG